MDNKVEEKMNVVHDEVNKNETLYDVFTPNNSKNLSNSEIKKLLYSTEDEYHFTEDKITDEQLKDLLSAVNPNELNIGQHNEMDILNKNLELKKANTRLRNITIVACSIIIILLSILIGYNIRYKTAIEKYDYLESQIIKINDRLSDDNNSIENLKDDNKEIHNMIYYLFDEAGYDWENFDISYYPEEN